MLRLLRRAAFDRVLRCCLTEGLPKRLALRLERKLLLWAGVVGGVGLVLIGKEVLRERVASLGRSGSCGRLGGESGVGVLALEIGFFGFAALELRVSLLELLCGTRMELEELIAGEER